jgi:2-hydroxychromene-2-carboxylate isomerase
MPIAHVSNMTEKKRAVESRQEAHMTTPIDLYWSFRSPYSYLALAQINDIAARRDVSFNLRVVHPLAIRDPKFFDSRGLPWMGYVMRDIVRLAQMTGQPMAMPNPDPIVQDIATARIAKDQPYIFRLSRLGILAAEAGVGLPFITTASRLIWGGEAWTEGDHLAQAMAEIGIDLPALDAAISGREAELDARLHENDQALRKAGHWGVPTCVVAGEPFFGMDRLDVLEWRLDQMDVG